MKERTRDQAQSAIDLLQVLISTPSYSKTEDQTADIMQRWLEERGVPSIRHANNVCAKNKHYKASRPTLLLNSHHDTVRPNKGYTRDPLKPILEDGRLYGLGSNDAGGCLVSLLSTFLHFYDHEDLVYNIVLIASAEEEISGANGLALALPEVGPIDLAIVGEPTSMDMAIAEKGLIVYDGIIHGTSSHAAHDNDDNPIYTATKALQWIRDYRFEKTSQRLGPVKMTVTQINAGSQHNTVPSQVSVVIDVRVNDAYSNIEIDQILQQEAPLDLVPRSLRLNSSTISEDHPLVRIGVEQGRRLYGSSTLSDQYALACPSIKMGPGDTLRSHTADEYIYTQEIADGIDGYISLLTPFLKQKNTRDETLG